MIIYAPIRDNCPFNSKIIGWAAIEGDMVIDSDLFLSELKKRNKNIPRRQLHGMGKHP